MNEDEMQALEPRAGDELERMLARYARVRLDPTPAASRRARSAVLEQAWRRRLAGSLGVAGRDDLHTTAAMAATSTQTVVASPRRGVFASWTPRRLGASMAAAVVAGLLVGGTTFAGSRAGGPLYTPRIALEELTLPSEPAARVDAMLVLAQTRLADAVDASGRGDVGALDAALGAYESEIGALPDAGQGPSDRALAAVTFHRELLERLLASAPSGAAQGLTTALDRSGGVIAELKANGAVPAGASGGGTGGGENPNAGGGNPNAGSGSNAHNPNAGGGNPNAGGGNPNAGSGNSSGGSNPNAGGGNPNAGSGGSNGGGNQNTGGDNPNAGAGGSTGGDEPPHPDRTPKPAHSPAPQTTLGPETPASSTPGGESQGEQSRQP